MLAVYVFKARSEGEDNADDGCLALGEDNISYQLCGAFDRKTIRKALNRLIERQILFEDRRPGPHNARRCALNRPLLRAMIQSLDAAHNKNPGLRRSTRKNGLSI